MDRDTETLDKVIVSEKKKERRTLKTPKKIKDFVRFTDLGWDEKYVSSPAQHPRPQVSLCW